MNGKLIILSLYILCFLLIILLSFLLKKYTPTEGYEISIYTIIPSTIWIILILLITCSISIITYQVTSKKIHENIWWLLGLLIIILCNMIILQLPLIKGYATYGRWDTPMHIGYINDIIISGHVPSFIIYPVTHILIADIIIISNVLGNILINFIIPLPIIIYNIFILCLAKVALTDPGKIRMAVVSSTVLLLSWTNYQVLPNYFSIFMTPILLYIYFKLLRKVTIEFVVIYIIIVLIYPFFHPLTSLFLVFAFAIMNLLKLILCNDYIYILSNSETIKKLLNIPLMLFITFIAWISGHYGFWNNNLSKVINWFIGEATTTTICIDILGLFKKLNLSIYNIIDIFLRMYGHIMLFLIFVLYASILIIKRIFINHRKGIDSIFILIGWLVIGIILLLLNVFFTILPFGFWRILAIIIVVSPLFVGYGLDEFFKNFNFGDYKGKYIFKTVFLIGVLTIASIIGIFNTYPSPYTYQLNQQITNIELIGMGWYYSYKNVTIPDRSLKMDTRFAIMLFGTNGVSERRDIADSEQCPTNFGYTNHTLLGNSFGTEVYIPISKYDKIFYTEMYQQLNEFTKNDFQNLTRDPTVYHLYTNGELDVYLVNGTNLA